MDNLERRLDTLIGLVDGIASDALAIELLLQAIIATHPDRERLASMMEQILSARLLQLSDAAFERKTSPARAHGMLEDLRAKAMHWIREAREAAQAD